jgi:hypothetical protein
MYTEYEFYAGQFAYHSEQLVERLRTLPPDRWDWTPLEGAPTPRQIATNAWQWLVSDRQHLTEPDAKKHPRIPDPPHDPDVFCDLLEEECYWWLDAMKNTPPEQMNTGISMFGGDVITIRCYLGHMLQNIIYKNGQISVLYFGLGFDGAGPYVPPLPNESYDALHAGLPLP